jgi:hypothetical protein
MKLSDLYELPGLLLSGLFALFAFILFYSNTMEPLKSLAAAVFVFFLTWLAYTSVRWLFEMF